MRQTTLATAGFDRYSQPTQRALFLADMDCVCALIEPVYPKPGKGRSPLDLERMLRIYFLQQWFNLSDPGTEEALYDSLAMRRFAGIDLGREPVPDETTICKFRHLLERHALGSALFEHVHACLEQHGPKLSRGTIVDATIIHAPSSAKNATQARGPDMHHQVEGAGLGRALLRDEQARVRLHQSPQPGAGQEHAPVVRELRADQPVPGARLITAALTGGARPKHGLLPPGRGEIAGNPVSVRSFYVNTAMGISSRSSEAG